MTSAPPRTATANEERPAWAPAPGPVVGLRVVSTSVVHSVPAGRSLTLGNELGRDSILADKSVSRTHCHLEWRGEELWLRDAGSRNGTFVNDLRVESVRIVDGNIIKIGRTRLVAFSAQSHGRSTREELLVGQSLPFGAAVDRAVNALINGPGVVVAGERGAGRTALARTLHELVCGPNVPFLELRCILNDRTRSIADGVWKSRARLQEQCRGGLVYIHELNAQAPTMQSRIAHPVIDLAERRELRFVISQSAACADGVLPTSLPVVTLPPLRERGPGDLGLLVDFFLAHDLRERANRVALSPEVLRALTTYAWPGNVAELAKTMERIAALVRHDGIAAHAARALDLDRETLREWFVRRSIPLVGLLRDGSEI